MTDNAEFIRSVCYFWTERGDPTRYSGWDDLRCARLMPAFYRAWTEARIYHELATLACKDAEEREEGKA